MGIPVYIADLRSKELMGTDPGLRKRLEGEFGSKIYAKKGLDRKALAQIIFNNPNKLALVNSIVHPYVRNDFMEWAKANHNSKYIIEEAAILFETGLYKEFDQIITVVAPKETRIARVMARDNTTRENIESRMKNQWEDAEKIKLSNFVINNSDKDFVVPQVLNIHFKLI